MRIGLVTDSTADIPAELCARHNIEVIPAIVVMGHQSYRDGIDLSRRQFYERLPGLSTPPTTATPAPGVFQAAYEKLLQGGAQAVLAIHIASSLSGICNTAKLAAQAFGERVQVIDSRSLSMGLGFQVLAAAEAAAAGLPLDAIRRTVHHVGQRVRVFAMLDTLEYIRRSGRVSWAAARLGSLLQVKLFVEVRNGAVLNLGQTRTRKKGIAHLKALLAKIGPIEQLAVLHSNAENDARRFRDDLLPHLQLRGEAPLVNTTPVIGTHVGPNGLGFAAVRLAP